MRFLIDGYNLLHAMGVVGGRLGPAGLEKARLRLLGLLKGAFGAEASSVTVIFDAAGAPAGAPEQTNYEGLSVRFAVRHAQADDLIEELIHQASVPGHLTVVSDDRRIRDAARRRRCRDLPCLEFLDELARKRGRRRPSPAEDERQPHATETEHWLEEFADLEEDSDLRPFFDLDRFEDNP
jgi:predicted RNA-binding protein with PIN domain